MKAGHFWNIFGWSSEPPVNWDWFYLNVQTLILLYMILTYHIWRSLTVKWSDVALLYFSIITETHHDWTWIAHKPFRPCSWLAESRAVKLYSLEDSKFVKIEGALFKIKLLSYRYLCQGQLVCSALHQEQVWGLCSVQRMISCLKWRVKAFSDSFQRPFTETAQVEKSSHHEHVRWISHQSKTLWRRCHITVT